MFGMWSTAKGLIAMMLGGLGSIPGAAGGQTLFGPQVRELLAWALLFLVLVARPGGLFGHAAVDLDATARQRL
jgi:branched-subunit amino acid ABC-type transport system permease component